VIFGTPWGPRDSLEEVIAVVPEVDAFSIEEKDSPAEMMSASRLFT
jgi:hypothetical protein